MKAVALVAVLVLAACTAKDPPVTAAAIAPASASSPASASAPAPAPGSASAPATAPASTFSAWTDPAAVDALARDCRAKPPATEADAPDPLACKLPFDQSCAYDPCYEKNQDCRTSCSKTCTSCDDACGGACDACAAACKDDACRHDCAARAGACKQACVTSLDRCATGTCGRAVIAACAKSEAARWRAHGCSCKKIAPCTNACIEASTGGMWSNTSCFKRCAARFPGCDVNYCVTGSDPTDPGAP